jgi:hypothetical protein
MVRVLLPFMAGIIMCIALSATSQIPITIWISFLVLTIGAGIFPFKTRRFIKLWLFGVFASLFLFVTGYNSVLLHKEILSAGHFSKHYRRKNIVLNQYSV